jgi:hypothetical protein
MMPQMLADAGIRPPTSFCAHASPRTSILQSGIYTCIVACIIYMGAGALKDKFEWQASAAPASAVSLPLMAAQPRGARWS